MVDDLIEILFKHISFLTMFDVFCTSTFISDIRAQIFTASYRRDAEDSEKVDHLNPAQNIRYPIWSTNKANDKLSLRAFREIAWQGE